MEVQFTALISLVAADFHEDQIAQLNSSTNNETLNGCDKGSGCAFEVLVRVHEMAAKTSGAINSHTNWQLQLRTNFSGISSL